MLDLITIKTKKVVKVFLLNHSHTRSWKSTLLSQLSFFCEKTNKQSACAFIRNVCIPLISSILTTNKNIWWWSWISCIPSFVARFLMLHLFYPGVVLLSCAAFRKELSTSHQLQYVKLLASYLPCQSFLSHLRQSSSPLHHSLLHGQL